MIDANVIEELKDSLNAYKRILPCNMGLYAKSRREIAKKVETDWLERQKDAFLKSDKDKRHEAIRKFISFDRFKDVHDKLKESDKTENPSDAKIIENAQCGLVNQHIKTVEVLLDYLDGKDVKPKAQKKTFSNTNDAVDNYEQLRYAVNNLCGKSGIIKPLGAKAGDTLQELRGDFANHIAHKGLNKWDFTDIFDGLMVNACNIERPDYKGDDGVIRPRTAGQAIDAMMAYEDIIASESKDFKRSEINAEFPKKMATKHCADKEFMARRNEFNKMYNAVLERKEQNKKALSTDWMINAAKYYSDREIDQRRFAEIECAHNATLNHHQALPDKIYENQNQMARGNAANLKPAETKRYEPKDMPKGKTVASQMAWSQMAACSKRNPSPAMIRHAEALASFYVAIETDKARERVNNARARACGDVPFSYEFVKRPKSK